MLSLCILGCMCVILITIALLAFSWLLFKGLLQQTWLGFLGFAFKYFNLLLP